MKLGYWFRRGLRTNPPTFHLVRYEIEAELVTTTAACSAVVMRHPATPATELPQTPRDALNAADANQRAHLCPRCIATLYGKTS